MHNIFIFSSSEPKAVVVVVVVAINLLFSNLYSLPKPLGQFHPKSIKHKWVKRIQICSIEGSRPFLRGDDLKLLKNVGIFQ